MYNYTGLLNNYYQLLKLFIIGISSDDDPITVNSIFRKFLPRSEEWYKVGMELGLDTQTLSRISLRYQENPDLALMETVRQWLKKTDNPHVDLLNTSLRHEQGKEFPKRVHM